MIWHFVGSVGLGEIANAMDRVFELEHVDDIRFTIFDARGVDRLAIELPEVERFAVSGYGAATQKRDMYLAFICKDPAARRIINYYIIYSKMVRGPWVSRLCRTRAEALQWLESEIGTIEDGQLTEELYLPRFDAPTKDMAPS